MASVDSIRVYRGVYSGFALAMSEAAEGLHFDELPSSDELAGNASLLAREFIESDQRETMPSAQQEFTAMLVCLALIEHQGRVADLTPPALKKALDGLWRLLGDRWFTE